MSCLASGNFCHPWPLPHLSARGLQPLPGIWLSELAVVQASLLPATESGLVTQGPCFFFSFSLKTDSSGPVLCIHTGSLPATASLPPAAPNPTDLALSLRLERLGRGPGEVSHPSTAGLWSKPAQGPCWSCSGLRIHWGNPDCDFQSCSSGPLTVIPIPGWC